MKRLSLALLPLLAACAATVKPSEPAVGAALPLIVTDMQGRTHDLDAVLAGGEEVALIFWQSW